MDFGVLDNPKKGKATKTTAVTPQHFNIEDVKKAFEPYAMQVKAMVKQAEAIVIEDEQANAIAVTMAGDARKLSKQIDGTKLAATARYREFVNQANGLGKMFVEPLEKVVSIVKKKTEDFAYKKIIAQRKKAEEERKDREELQKKLDADAVEAGVEKVNLPATATPAFSGVTRTESGSSVSVRLVWKGEITDLRAVPREYCEPAQKLIDQAVAAGVRKISGVKIEEVPESRLRA